MGLEDRDYMRAQPETAAPKILGLPRAQFFLYAVILIALAGFGVWKSGIFDKKDADKPAGPVNVNKASVEELKALPDVDEKIAADIVKKRPFKKVEDLLDVKGIGAKKLEKLKPLVIIE